VTTETRLARSGAIGRRRQTTGRQVRQEEARGFGVVGWVEVVGWRRSGIMAGGGKGGNTKLPMD